MRAVSLLLVVAAMALVAGGCGSKGNRLSKAEFVKQANAICAKYERRVQKRMAGIPAGDEAQLASSIEKVLPVIREGNDELRSLKPPDGLQGHYDRWMKIADAEVAAASKLQKRAAQGRPPGNPVRVRRAADQGREDRPREDRLARRGGEARLGCAGVRGKDAGSVRITGRLDAAWGEQCELESP